MSTKNLVIVLGSLVLMLGIMMGGFFFIWQKMSLTMAQVQEQQVVDEKQVQEKKAPKEPLPISVRPRARFLCVRNSWPT